MLRIVFISFLFLSCNQKDDSAEPNEYAAKFIIDLNKSDTFRYEFPERNGVFDSSLYRDMEAYRKVLGLDYLENGYDSIQIRLNYGGPMAGERLVILLNKNGEWKAEISKITTIENPHFKAGNLQRVNTEWSKDYLPQKNSQYNTPKSGWKKFIRNLFDLNILTLPDEEKIVKVNPGLFNDGVGVNIEISTNTVYRLYGNGNPDYLFNDFQEARDISNILKLVDAEFGLKQLWDYTNDIPLDTTTRPPIKSNELELKEIEPEK